MTTKSHTENTEFKGILEKYALILVEIKALGTRTFSYLIPDELRGNIKIGQAVLVPFGRQKPIKGFVVGFSDYLEEGINAKNILKILDAQPVFDILYLKFLEWVANYYASEIQSVLEMAVPLKFLGEEREKTEKWIVYKNDFGASKRAKELLNELEKAGTMPVIEFEKLYKTTRTTVNKLFESGNVDIVEKNVYRNPLGILKIAQGDEFPELSDEQAAVYKEVEKRLEAHSAEPILLYGVTASGKTEIYFKAIKKIIEKGQTVLFLAPEIALASELTRRLAKRFGKDNVAIWHSSISEGERYDVWEKLKSNEIKILAGARSAVFAPLKNIGLIIIDEQHESAFKQSQPAPRYDARVVAKKLSEMTGAKLLMGSATPDVEDFFAAKNSSNLLSLTKRFNDAPLANVITVDMRDEFYKGNKTIFSRRLVDALKNNIENKEQSIVLINRRGFSTALQCSACGEVIECEKCAIPLIYHKPSESLKCHYCGFESPVPSKCPSCAADAVIKMGSGTQRIEEIIKKLFPEASVERLDSDVTAKKTAYIDVLERFHSGETDILVGTQMIAKGLDNPNVTLVAAVNADLSFSLPDYRASERGFSLLTQLAGRSGRGKTKGRVYFQSFNPEFFAFETAKNQDYIEFYKNEIATRQEFDYPPFSKLIRLVISSASEIRAEKSAMEIAMRLETILEKKLLQEHVTVMGPSKCVIERLQGQYRFQILIKNKVLEPIERFEKVHNFITSFLKKVILPNDIKMVVDVDPLDII